MINTITIYTCDTAIDVEFDVVDVKTGGDKRPDVVEKKFAVSFVWDGGERMFYFPYGKSSSSPESIFRLFWIDVFPTYASKATVFLCHMDHKIPLEEIINTPQEELNKKYFDKQFEKRYPHRVEKVKPVRKARAKQVTEKKENCGCKKNLKGNEKNKKTKKNH